MAITTAWLEDHLDFAMEHYSQTVTIDGDEYACAAGEQSRSCALDDSGYLDKNGVEIMVKTSLFTSAPEPGDTLVFNSITYRIETVTRSPDGIHTVFICVEENN